MSTRPHRVCTWAPRGQTPVLHETFNWKSLSIIGGITLWSFCFRIHAGSIKSQQVVEFLKALHRHLKGARLRVISRGRCWMLDAGCWMLGAGCWVLGAGCWVLDYGIQHLAEC